MAYIQVYNFIGGGGVYQSTTTYYSSQGLATGGTFSDVVGIFTIYDGVPNGTWWVALRDKNSISDVIAKSIVVSCATTTTTTAAPTTTTTTAAPTTTTTRPPTTTTTTLSPTTTTTTLAPTTTTTTLSGFATVLAISPSTGTTYCTTNGTITSNSVILGYEVTASGSSSVTQSGIIMSSVHNPPSFASGDTFWTNNVPGLIQQCLTLSTLSANTLYYYRAWALNTAGYAYSTPTYSFTTSSITTTTTLAPTTTTTTTGLINVVYDKYDCLCALVASSVQGRSYQSFISNRWYIYNNDTYYIQGTGGSGTDGSLDALTLSLCGAYTGAGQCNSVVTSCTGC